MRAVLLIVGFLAFVLLAGVAHAAVDRTRKKPHPPLNVEAMIEAIADVESGNDHSEVGDKGELGRCQFMPATWRRYTNAPFQVYARTDCELTRKVEKAHLSYVCAYLLRRGYQLEPALIAAAWRFGEGRAAAFVRADSARRTANLYFDMPNRPAKPLRQ
jgi:hypothetical protein